MKTWLDYQNDVNYALGIDLFTFEALKKVDPSIKDVSEKVREVLKNI